MRIKTLTLARFGMFTDVKLEFLPSGVTVIVGENEAGKTTAMEAMRQFFFGMPVRSGYAYIHALQNLRVGALLLNSSGEERELYRIKRQTGTLRSSTDEQVDEAVLGKLLAGIDANTFSSLFSIATDEVVEGGKLLLSTEGDLGQALFSAGTGLTKINNVLTGLQGEADRLFKSNGSSPQVNRDLRVYREATKEIRELSVRARDVLELDEQITVTQRELDETQGSISGLRERRASAIQSQASRVLVGATRAARSELAVLESQGQCVDPKMEARLKSIREERNAAQAGHAIAEKDIAALEQQQVEIDVDHTLLAQQSSIEDLLKEIGALRQNMKDLPSLNKQVGDLEREIQAIRRQMPDSLHWSEDGLPVIPATARAAIPRLARRELEIKGRLEAAKVNRADILREFQKATAAVAEMAPIPDVEGLRMCAARVRAEGPIEKNLDELKRKRQELLDGIVSDLASMSIEADPRAADSISLPDSEEVTRLANRLNRAESALSAYDEQRLELERELGEHERVLGELIRQEDPPTVSDLLAARSHRDDGWEFIRARLLRLEQDVELVNKWRGNKSLERAFEAATRAADDIADRLWQNVGAAEQRRLLESQAEARKDALAQHCKGRHELEQQCQVAAEAWKNSWQHLAVEVGEYLQMTTLATQLREAGRGSREVRELDRHIVSLEQTVSRHRGDLLAAANLNGESTSTVSLASLLDAAERSCREADVLREGMEKARERNNNLAEQCSKQEAEVVRQQSEYDDWLSKWVPEMTAIGLSAEATTDDADAVMSLVASLEKSNHEVSEKKLRVEGIERRNRTIGIRLRDVTSTLPSEHSVDIAMPEAAINILSARVRENLDKVAAQKSIVEQLASKQEALSSYLNRLLKCDVQLKAMLTEVGSPDESALSQAIERGAAVQACREAIRLSEANLLQTVGLSISEAEQQVDAFVSEDIDQLKSELAGQLDRLEQVRTQQMEQLGRLKEKRAITDSSDRAAEAAERAQRALASVRSGAEEYMRVVVAKALLEEQVAKYREENQGPLLGRAGALLAELTCGRYIGLEAELGERGALIVLAKMSTGDTIAVEDLSTGARDQLYLSLRLAALEHFADRREAMPLTLDDLFVHFDDNRTRAGLCVLEKLSNKLQVLLFTHHESVAVLAEQVVPADRLRIVRLASREMDGSPTG